MLELEATGKDPFLLKSDLLIHTSHLNAHTEPPPPPKTEYPPPPPQEN